MIIQTIAIKHWRCLRQFRMSVEPLTALLGRNGVGKSSVIGALDVFYDTAAPITHEDFYNRDTSQPIEITVTYGDLRQDELMEFAAYLSQKMLTVTKRITYEAGRYAQRYYAAIPQYPEFVEIRTVPGARDRTNAWNALADSKKIPGWQHARSAADVESQMASFEAGHPQLLQPIEKEEQFFGPPNVGGGKLDNYTKFVVVPAVKDVSDEFVQRRGSSLYQLLDLIVHRKIESRDDISRKRVEIQAQVRELYQPLNLPELRELGTDISALLGRFFPGAELILDWNEVSVPDLALPSARSRLVEDEFEGDINKKGHGLQRALLITLLQYLAQLNVVAAPENAPADVRGGTQGTPNERVGLGPSLIIAIEEPELYLHPLRCRYLANLFNELTRVPARNQEHANQVIFTSHSPHFVDLRQFENIRIIRKRRSLGMAAPESLLGSFAVADALRRLTEISGLEPSLVTVESFKAHILPVMSSIVGEGFFADAVVLVEGFGDVGVFMKLQEVLGKSWITRGIALIPVEGKTKLDRPALIFSGMGIPTYLIFDGDKQHASGSYRESTIRTNRTLLRLVGAPEEDFPVSRVEATWSVFEFNIERALIDSIGEDLYNSLCGRVASDFGIDRPTQVMKSLHCSSALTELIYQEGHSLPFLESIIEAATHLVP